MLFDAVCCIWKIFLVKKKSFSRSLSYACLLKAVHIVPPIRSAKFAQLKILEDLKLDPLGTDTKACNSENAGKACIEINKTNHDGNTALHIAALTGYTEAVKLLLARAEIKAQIKNKNNKTACDIAKATLNSLSAAKLSDLKIMPEQTTAKIQAINNARTEIVSLLTAKNACK